MRVSTNLKAGGYLESAAQEAGKAWGEVTNFVARAEAEAQNLTSQALSTTTAVTNWMADTLNKFS
ncbi:MAG: hypothetical protein ACWGN2_03140 [Anaerolineales bacterium]|jgi:hypothetical protein